MGIFSRLSRLVRAEVSHHTGKRAPPPRSPRPGASSPRPHQEPPPGAPPTHTPAVREAYKVLGVPAGSSREITRDAWRDGLMDSHPDHHPNDPTAEERTLKLQEAWEVLEVHFGW